MEKSVVANWFDTYAGPESGRPLLGATVDYLNLDDERVRELIRTKAPSAVRELVDWDIRVARGGTEGIGDYYAKFPKGCRAFLVAARIAVHGALLTKDMTLFRRVYADVDRFPAAWPSPDGKMAAEAFVCWLKQLCYVGEGYPDWLERLDWTAVPPEWRYQISAIAAKVVLVQCHFEAALAITSVCRLFGRADGICQSFETWTALYAAIACREMGRHTEELRWYRRAAELAAPKGFFLPFLSYSLGSGSPMVTILEEVSPEIVPKIRAHVDTYYQSVILMRNLLTGGHVTTDLSRREFYIACCLRMGLSYKEIALRTGVSVGRVRNIISDIYTKLGIHSRIQLTGLVW